MVGRRDGARPRLRLAAGRSDRLFSRFMKVLHCNPLLSTGVRCLPTVAALTLFAPVAQAAPAPPPGFNVHLVQESGGRPVWRGGAPRRDTLDALARSARARGVVLTLIDLRAPANSDDQSGKKGRLAPRSEEALSRKLGVRYVSVSALDRQLPARLQAALKQGDVYMHCMYGVNRTGFAAARYASAARVSTTTAGLGKRDWRQGAAFQATLERGRR